MVVSTPGAVSSFCISCVCDVSGAAGIHRLRCQDEVGANTDRSEKQDDRQGAGSDP